MNKLSSSFPLPENPGEGTLWEMETKAHSTLLYATLCQINERTEHDHSPQLYNTPYNIYIHEQIMNNEEQVKENNWHFQWVHKLIMF